MTIRAEDEDSAVKMKIKKNTAKDEKEKLLKKKRESSIDESQVNTLAHHLEKAWELDDLEEPQETETSPIKTYKTSQTLIMKDEKYDETLKTLDDLEQLEKLWEM